MNTIKAEWESFETICLQGAPDDHRHNAHVAFYAGVMSILDLQSKAARKIISPEEAKVIVQAWQQELVIFKIESVARAMDEMAQARH